MGLSCSDGTDYFRRSQQQQLRMRQSQMAAEDAADTMPSRPVDRHAGDIEDVEFHPEQPKRLPFQLEE